MHAMTPDVTILYGVEEGKQVLFDMATSIDIPYATLIEQGTEFYQQSIDVAYFNTKPHSL